LTGVSKVIIAKQQSNLENAKKWLRRAQMDFNAFKRIAPFDEHTHKAKRCTDPALAVYLLQQSIEKATKAVAVATGKYSNSQLRSHSHNSLIVLLDFYQKSLTSMTEVAELNTIGMGFGIDLNEGLNKIISLMVEVGKTPGKRKEGEILYSEQFAMATDIQIDTMLDLLLALRGDAFLGTLKSVFGPHGKVVIDKQKLNTSTPEDFVSSTFDELGKQLNISLSEDNSKVLETVVRLFAPNGIIDEDSEKNIVIERPTKEQLGQWSLIALLILAMYTFPHESTSRYPSPSVKWEFPISTRNEAS